MRRSWIAVCPVAVLLVLGSALADVGESGQEARDVRVPTGEEAPLEAMLPADTIFFASVRDVPALLRKLREQPLFKLLLEEGFFEGLMPPEALTRCRGFYERYVKPLGAILRGEAAFAITEFDRLESEPEQLLVLADVGGREAALKAYLEETIYPWVDGSVSLERREVTVGGTSFTGIGKMGLDDERAVFGVQGGVFMLTPGLNQRALLAECLALDRDKSLASNPWFVKVEEALSGADFIEYLNLGALDRQAYKYLVEEEDVPIDYQSGWGLFRIISGFDPLEAVGVGMTFGGEGGGTTTVRLVGDGPHGGIFGALARKAPVLKSLKYVGDDAAVYFAVSLGNLSLVYKDFVNVLDKHDELMEEDSKEFFELTLESIGEALGVDVVKELIPAFGGEVAVAVWIPGGLDVPPAAVMVEVKDKETVGEFVDTVLELIADAAGGAIQAESHMYNDVKVITLDGVPHVIPAVAIVDDFLVVATNASVIEDMIDARAEGPHLGEADGYKQYVSSIPGDAAITLYVDVKRIADFGWPILAERMGPGMAEPGARMSMLGVIVKAMGELRQALSPFGMKVVGDQTGVTITTRSANGGLGTPTFLGGFATLGLIAHFEPVEAPPAGAVVVEEFEDVQVEDE